MLHTRDSEAAKYQRCWDNPAYRIACHSVSLWEERRDLFPTSFSSALDIGCGLGKILDVWNILGIETWGVDLVENCLDPGIAKKWGHQFRLDCLWVMKWDRRFDLGICTDVMEHIPPDRVHDTLARIGECCNKVIFKIAHSPNHLDGESLHLTLEDYNWWVETMNRVGGSAKYLGTMMRSGCQDSLVRWEIR